MGLVARAAAGLGEGHVGEFRTPFENPIDTLDALRFGVWVGELALVIILFALAAWSRA